MAGHLRSHRDEILMIKIDDTRAFSLHTYNNTKDTLPIWVRGSNYLIFVHVPLKHIAFQCRD